MDDENDDDLIDEDPPRDPPHIDDVIDSLLLQLEIRSYSAAEARQFADAISTLMYWRKELDR